MGVDVPTEILLHISRYIPNDRLQKMLGVNRLFYNIGMDLRYRDVLIATRSMNTLKSVVRLRCPEVARRVRRLEIRLSLMKPKGNHQNSEPVGSTQVVKQIFNNALRRVFGSLAQSSSHEKGKSPSSKDPFTAMITELGAAFPAMINVQELLIDSWDLPPQYDLHPFLASAWYSFGRNLHTVSLGGNLEGYRVLINSNPPFESLKHLRVQFTNNLFRVDLEADRTILVRTVAPFVNRLGPQLVSMRVWSWTTLDLSAFFVNIGPFPQLEYLDIRITFNKAFREGLQRLLCEASSTLQRIDLRLNTGPVLDRTSQGSLCRWLLKCLEDQRCFVNARALDIYPTNVPGAMDLLLRSIQRTAEHLTELTVRDYYLFGGEIKVLLEALTACRNLTYLRLNVWRMNVALFDIMAIKAPGLRRLWISVGDTAGDPSASVEKEKFRTEIGTRFFTEWRVKDLTIWQGGAKIDRITMVALAHSIPSVNSFWGNGHMEIE